MAVPIAVMFMIVIAVMFMIVITVVVVVVIVPMVPVMAVIIVPIMFVPAAIEIRLVFHGSYEVHRPIAGVILAAMLAPIVRVLRRHV